MIWQINSIIAGRERIGSNFMTNLAEGASLAAKIRARGLLDSVTIDCIGQCCLDSGFERMRLYVPCKYVTSQ